MTSSLKLKIYLFIINCILFGSVYGQQRFNNNLRSFNDLFMNPAKIMESHGASFYLNHRQQFWNMRQNSPSVTVVGFKTNLNTRYSQNLLYTQKNRSHKYNYAIGGYYLNSFTGGIYEQNEFCGQFGIQWKFGQNLEMPDYYNQLNFGITLKGMNNKYRGNSIYLYDKNDIAFSSVSLSDNYQVSIIPGFQYVNDVIHIDGFYSFGPKDQEFAGLSFMGSPELNGFFKETALRLNYFGNQNIQVALSKVHDLGSGLSNNIWSFNYGLNVIVGKKYSDNSSIVSNPGLFFGIIYKNIGKPSKRKPDFKKPMRKNIFKGAINLFDANFNTLYLGPSAEAGLVLSRNTVVCECDRMYDQFLLDEARNTENLGMLKNKETTFLKECNTIEYKSSYEKYSVQIHQIIANLEEDLKEKEIEKGAVYETTLFGTQEWHCENISFTEGITLVRSQAEWDKLSPKKPCYCYINFDEGNKSYGLLYNSKAFNSISNNSKLKNSGFRVAVKEDWDKLFRSAKQQYFVERLYNCDGLSKKGFNLKNSGFFDQEVWYKPEDGQTNFWLGEDDVYGFQCDSKGEIMLDEIAPDLLRERRNKSAFHIRIIKSK